MIKECFAFHAAEGTDLYAVVWRPVEEPKAIIQICHGMTEHMDRYNDFAQTMAHRGIVVAGFDLRGHGQNPGDPDCAAMGTDGWKNSLQDMHLFFRLLGRKFPGIPHYMLGFSLGSFLLREYLGMHPDGIHGAIIAGTGQQSTLLLSIMMAIVSGEIRKAGPDATTDLVRKLSFGVYNDKFKPNRTAADWLCSDPEQLDLYLADPLCRKTISAGLFHDLLGSMKRSCNAASYHGWNKAMPILLLSGDRDPVGDMGRGVQLVDAAMNAAGFANVTTYLLPDARHDLFHEVAGGNADAAKNLILDWMQL